jgi:hypothetical protein
MDFLWAREVFQEGPLKAHETYNIQFHTVSTFHLTEAEEYRRREFVQVSKDAIGQTGHWRISDARQFVEVLLEQYHKVHRSVPFESSPNYFEFALSMLNVLGIRWTAVPVLLEYTERRLDDLRRVSGSKNKPADWTGNIQQEARRYFLSLRSLYFDAKVGSDTLPWWSEFRRLRLFSTETATEVALLHQECSDAQGEQNFQQLDHLVEELLNIDDSAVHFDFVRHHLMEHRQDLIKDCHICDPLVGLFNQLSNETVPQPAPWYIIFPRRLYPHQCQVFAAKLLETIHSGKVSLQSQVKAAGQLTLLPTTTIIELAELLKEGLNPRITEAILMFLPHLDEPAAAIQFLLAPIYLDGDLARTAVFSVRHSLRHVPADQLPKVLVPVFPLDDSKRRLKVTVMKELIRVVFQHIQYEEHQTLLMAIWKHKLHQDGKPTFNTV